jgi:hypothetical protein
MTAWRPERIVLPSAERPCEGAATALGRAGYKPRLQSRGVLDSDGVGVWVKIYKVEPQIASRPNYNRHRPHSSLSRQPPISRLSHPHGQYS